MNAVTQTAPPEAPPRLASTQPQWHRPAPRPYQPERDDYNATHAGRMLTTLCHGASRDAGWWTNLATGNPIAAEGPIVGQKMMLIVSEVSEAMEGHRRGLMDDKLPHRRMVEVELADAVIRIADLAGALGLDLGAAIAEKMAYNAQRADHKPEARAAVGGKAY